MTAVARLGDRFSDNDTVAQGSSNVFLNGLPGARLGDLTVGHDDWPPVPIISACSTVFANNRPLAVMGSRHAIHCAHDDCHDGVIIDGSNNINIE